MCTRPPSDLFLIRSSGKGTDKLTIGKHFLYLIRTQGYTVTEDVTTKLHLHWLNFLRQLLRSAWLEWPGHCAAEHIRTTFYVGLVTCQTLRDDVNCPLAALSSSVDTKKCDDDEGFCKRFLWLTLQMTEEELQLTSLHVTRRRLNNCSDIWCPPNCLL